jgi:DNA mismatch repair ATPase MutS
MSTQYQPHPMNIPKGVISQLFDEVITSVVTQQASQEISTQTDPCVDVIDRMSEEFDTETQRLTKENEFIKENYEKVIDKLHSEKHELVKEMDFFKMKCVDLGVHLEQLEDELDESANEIHLMREERGDFLCS